MDELSDIRIERCEAARDIRDGWGIRKAMGIAANESEQPNHPLWSRDGKELFYNPGPGDCASVSVMTQPTFAFGKTTRLVRPFRGASTVTRRPYDLTPDGRFVAAIPDEPAGGGRVPTAENRVVLNWFDELRARVPSPK